MAVAGDDVYLLVKRDFGYTLEQFDDTLQLDCALTGGARHGGRGLGPGWIT